MIDGPAIIEAESEEQISIVKSLFIEYARSLPFDLDFQDFEGELSSLPGEYSRPDGRLYFALVPKGAAGCVALRKIDDGICEMKRLYVRPGFRGKRIGRLLSEKIISEAKEIGYDKMRLDTVGSMREAISLYRTLGFVEIGQYRINPRPDAMFFELELSSWTGTNR